MGMTWKTTTPNQEREAFIGEHESGGFGLAELARRFGISRKTAYKWVERYREGGRAELTDRSRAPVNHPNAIGKAMEKKVLEMKAKWPRWGAPKILVKLRAQLGEEPCPSESSISRVLQRHGLVKPQGRRRARAQGTVLEDYTGPNAIWCLDFKGWFATGDGVICTPLTITDGFSRYLLRCQGLNQGTGGFIVRPILETTMREYGVPMAIRTDNGPPFASVGLGGLSELSVWWLRLGIRVERSRPGCPQDNGRHERMHRTLKEATAQPPSANARNQQRAFDEFRREFNDERPHEGLGGKTPGSVYEPSPRDYPDRMPEMHYREEWLARKVRPSGQIKWKGKSIYVSQALIGESVGLEPVEDGVWMVYFAACPIGLFDERQGRIQPLKKRHGHKR
jgi:putative transposase